MLLFRSQYHREEFCMHNTPDHLTGSTSTAIRPDMPSVAIVILNWNGKKFLEKFLPSVIHTAYSNKRIVVADNASADDSLLFLEKQYPTVEIIRNMKNFGFAGGYNAALRLITADYYVLLNSDVEVHPDWVGPVIEIMEADQTIGACQPKILSYNKKDVFEYAGASGGWIDIFGYPFARGRVLDVCETDHGQYDNAIPCFWASGAAMFVRSNVFHSLGGFDARFFAHQEEIDLCWRMQINGYKVYVQPASVVYHVGGGTLPKGNSLKTFLNYRNNLLMLYNNLSPAALIWILPIRLGLDGLSAWKMLFVGDAGYFFSVIKSHFHFVWMVITQKRRKKPKSKPMISGRYKGSMLIDYYLKKRRTFSQIVGNK